MKTGDTVRDGQGNSYQLGQLLGRGLWGKSYLVRRESTDSLHVLKVPLGPEDVRGDVATPDAVFSTAREALMESARLYEQAGLPFLPKLETRFTLPDGAPAIILPRYPTSLEEQLADGIPIAALLELLLTLVKLQRQIGAAGPAFGGLHGNLRPSNVLLNDRGDVFLTDLATAAVRRGLPKLIPHAPGGQPYLPPEITEGTSDLPWSTGADAYAIATILWRGVLSGDPLPPFPRRGLDKAAIVALKDKLVERMKLEDSNPRFHGRLAERVGVFLSRALSKETTPSPPYRFTRLDELQARLEEIIALVRPQVSSVGKVMPERTATKPWFDTDEVVSFTCTVGCSAGVEGQDEIGVGIAVFDLEKDTRLKELDLGYNVDKHPSGRYRFSFRIAGLNPGHYRARVAFAIRDSGQPPATTEHEFEIRAAAGWVPPAEPPPPGALPFGRETTSVTQGVEPHPTHVPVAEAPKPPVEAPVRAEAPRVASPLTSAPTAATTGAPPTPVASAPATRPAPPSTPAVPGTPPPILPMRADAPAEPTRPAARPEATRPELARAESPKAESRELPRAPEAGKVPSEPGKVARTVTAPEKPAPAPEPPEEPAYTPPKNWSYEPIPRADALRDEDEADRPSAPLPDPDDDVEPGILERGLAQLRNDPYVLVMASLTAVIVVLLLLYLVIRS